MSIEVLLTGLTEAVLGLTAQLKVTGENQERLIAGQAAAIEKVEAPKATRTRAKKEDAAAAAPVEEKKVEPAATTPEPAATVAVVTDDDLRAAATAYLTLDKDAAKTAVRKEFIAKMMAELGTPKLCGPESTLDDDDRKKAVFFINRAKAGLDVDFDGNYDLDGDPTQGGDATADDDFGI